MNNIFNAEFQEESLSWQEVNRKVNKGFEFQEIENDLNAEQILEFNDVIILSPDYQREYRSSISDESSLVESILIDIPIPPIFLANQKINGVQALNVVDGQHRLRALHRYLNDEYELRDLIILSDLNGLRFSDLHIDLRQKLYSSKIRTYTFRKFPGKDFELEIFRRYNKGTKPLTPQEIRHAVYGSKVNDMVNQFCTKLLNNNEMLSGAYAITKDRYLKKTCHESIFVILSIIENGIIQQYKDKNDSFSKISNSPQYAEKFMRHKSENDTVHEYNTTKNNFEKFNIFITALCKFTKYPFSKEIYGISSRGNKFQVSLSMIYSGIVHKLINQGFNFNTLLDDTVAEKLSAHLQLSIASSYLEDPSYSASTTNPVEVDKLVNEIDLSYLS